MRNELPYSGLAYDIGTYEPDDLVLETAEGAVASFDNGADDLPLKSLVVDIVPKQSGSGDPSPSNVRPITGWDEVEVVRCGKNLFNHTLTTRTVNGTTFTVNADKSITISGTPTAETRVVLSSGVFWEGKVSAVLSCGLTFPVGLRLFATKKLNGATTYPTLLYNGVSYAQLLADGAEWWGTVLEVATTFSGTITLKLQLEVGSTATAYEPYQGTSYPITLPSTVYGGTLDVVSGGGVSDIQFTVFDGTENWYSLSADGRFYLADFVPPQIDNIELEGISSIAKRGSTASLQVGEFGVRGFTASNGWIGFTMDSASYPSVDSFKSLLATLYNNGTPATVAVKLSTPTDFNTTPTPINTLLGSNNIWADTGDVNVGYLPQVEKNTFPYSGTKYYVGVFEPIEEEEATTDAPLNITPIDEAINLTPIDEPIDITPIEPIDEPIVLTETEELDNG